jgi:hypothetical protein
MSHSTSDNQRLRRRLIVHVGNRRYGSRLSGGRGVSRIRVSIACVLAAVLASPVASSGTAVAPGPTGTQPAERAPSLRRIRFRHGLDTLIWRDPREIAVSLRGRVVAIGDVGSGSHEGFFVQILSPGADTLISVARRGSGPGELSGVDDPFASDDTLHIFDLARRSDVIYTDAGRYVGERRLQTSTTEAVLDFVGDSVDVQPLRRGALQPEGMPTRRKIGAATGRNLFPASDPIVQQALMGDGHAVALVPVAVSGAVLAIGDGLSYDIRVFEISGRQKYDIHRQLPANRRNPDDEARVRTSLQRLIAQDGGRTTLTGQLRKRLDTLSRESVPYFGWPGLRFDGAGRLWVIGEIGDSTFADVFSGANFLGRRILPCAKPARRIALQGKWLALDCETGSAGAAPFRIQLYEIVDSG